MVSKQTTLVPHGGNDDDKLKTNLVTPQLTVTMDCEVEQHAVVTGSSTDNGGISKDMEKDRDPTGTRSTDDGRATTSSNASNSRARRAAQQLPTAIATTTADTTNLNNNTDDESSEDTQDDHPTKLIHKDSIRIQRMKVCIITSLILFLITTSFIIYKYLQNQYYQTYEREFRLLASKIIDLALSSLKSKMFMGITITSSIQASLEASSTRSAGIASSRNDQPYLQFTVPQFHLITAEAVFAGDFYQMYWSPYIRTQAERMVIESYVASDEGGESEESDSNTTTTSTTGDSVDSTVCLLCDSMTTQFNNSDTSVTIPGYGSFSCEMFIVPQLLDPSPQQMPAQISNITYETSVSVITDTILHMDHKFS